MKILVRFFMLFARSDTVQRTIAKNMDEPYATTLDNDQMI